MFGSVCASDSSLTPVNQTSRAVEIIGWLRRVDSVAEITFVPAVAVMFCLLWLRGVFVLSGIFARCAQPERAYPRCTTALTTVFINRSNLRYTHRNSLVVKHQPRVRNLWEEGYVRSTACPHYMRLLRTWCVSFHLVAVLMRVTDPARPGCLQGFPLRAAVRNFATIPRFLRVQKHTCVDGYLNVGRLIWHRFHNVYLQCFTRDVQRQHDIANKKPVIVHMPGLKATLVINSEFLFRVCPYSNIGAISQNSLNLFCKQFYVSCRHRQSSRECSSIYRSLRQFLLHFQYFFFIDNVKFDIVWMASLIKKLISMY